jgi:hypothetical protein
MRQREQGFKRSGQALARVSFKNFVLLPLTISIDGNGYINAKLLGLNTIFPFGKR